MLDKVLIKRLYDKGMNGSDIARQFNVSRQRIHQITENYTKFGVHGRKWKYQQSKLKYGALCLNCKEPMEVLHHKDLNNQNDNLSNLIPYCHCCHVEVHKTINNATRKYTTHYKKA